jgi:Poxvirus D5 protein-like
MQNDSVASFVADFVVSDAAASVPKQQLYQAYKFWCEDQGLHPVSQKKLKVSLEQIFPKLDAIRSSGGDGPWRWIGIRLTEDARCFAE